MSGEECKDIVQNKKESVIVMFHAHWCGHCKTMLPEYHKAAQMSRLPFLAVEDTNAGEMVNELGIQGYPTILRFEQGEKVGEYGGDPSAHAISQFGS